MAKTATIHLLDGDLTGSLKCSLGHWGVVVYKIPHELLNERSTAKKYEKALSTLKQCGIYFLFGKSTSDKYERGVYVGQAVTRANGRGVLGRVMEHDDIDWSEVVIFVSDNEDEHPLEPGLRYLERRFYELAKEANRYDLLNGNNPNSGYPTTFLKSNLEDFIDYAKIALYALGYNVLEPRPQKEVVDNPNPPVPVVELSLHMKYGKGEADGKYYSSDKFVVLKGSKINPNTTRTCREATIRQREDNADKIRNYKLIADITFKSPSAAASFVAGADLSGKMHWRDDTGTLLGKLLDGKVTPEPLPRQYKTPDDHGDSILNEGATLFRMKRRGCDAKGKWTGDKFIVLAGSKINPKPTDGCPKHILKIRKKFAKKIKGDKLVADIPFKSPSGAAGFVRGASSNGKIEWRDKKGRTFADSLDIHPEPEPEPSHKDGIPLHMDYKGYKAKGTYVGKREFIIHKGSEICPTEIPCCSDNIKKMRKKHAHKIKNGVLTEDITFGSSTTAAELVCGSARNGYTSWRNAKGIKLGKLLKG